MAAAKAAFDSPDFVQLGLTSRMGTGTGMLRTLERVRAGLRASQGQVAQLAASVAALEDPAVLLERSTETVETGNVEAANLVLEQYANTLQSTPLLQLAHARLSLPKLRALWQKVQTVDTAPGGGHEAQAAKWCEDFQRESSSLAEQSVLAQRQARTRLLEASTRTAVLQQQVMAQGQILKVLDRDAQSLHALLDRTEHQFDSTMAAIQELQVAAAELSSHGGSADVRKGVAGLFQTLGRAEGQASAGSSEMLDMINAAIQRRDEVVARMTQSTNQVQAALATAQQQRTALIQSSAEQVQSKAKDSSLQSRYEQMCSWTLDDLENRRHREECEKDAIHAALIVLSAH